MTAIKETRSSKLKPNPKEERSNDGHWWKPAEYPKETLICPVCWLPETTGEYEQECHCWDEEWKIIPSRPDHEASSLGRIRRIGGIVKSQFPVSNKVPYLASRLDKHSKALVHRLIAEAFIGPCPSLHEVNHKDGNKTNNLPSNLEYVTHGQNVRHAYQMGLNEAVRKASSESMRRKHAAGLIPHPMGAHPGSKLTPETARQVKQLFAAGKGDTEIGRIFSVRRETIRQVRQGKTWRDA